MRRRPLTGQDQAADTAAIMLSFLSLLHLCVLLGIAVTTQLVRLLGQAASGAVTSSGVAAYR